MSDGPFRGLNLNKAWKKFVERANNKAFTPEEVSEAIPLALQRVWKEEVSTKFQNKFMDLLKPDQYEVFSSDALHGLRNIDTGHTKSSLETILTDCAIHEVSNNGIAEKTLMNVCEEALKDRMSREMRRIEEHFHREGYVIEGRNIRSRMEEGFENTNFRSVASGAVSKNNSAIFPKLIKKAGLDQGVSF